MSDIFSAQDNAEADAVHGMLHSASTGYAQVSYTCVILSAMCIEEKRKKKLTPLGDHDRSF